MPMGGHLSVPGVVEACLRLFPVMSTLTSPKTCWSMFLGVSQPRSLDVVVLGQAVSCPPSHAS